MLPLFLAFGILSDICLGVWVSGKRGDGVGARNPSRFWRNALDQGCMRTGEPRPARSAEDENSQRPRDTPRQRVRVSQGSAR